MNYQSLIIAVVVFSLMQGFSILTSVFLAVALGATSMGVSLRSLMGVKEIDTRVGKTVIGSLVLNDITGLILLTAVAGYAGIVTGGGGNIYWQLAKVLISVIVFFVIFYIGVMYLPKLTTLSMRLKVEEAQFSLAIVIILISAWAASNFGLTLITAWCKASSSTKEFICSRVNPAFVAIFTSFAGNRAAMALSNG